MNRVNKTNWKNNFFLYFFVFCCEHPKWDQNPKFTPRRRASLHLSYGSHPAPAYTSGYKHQALLSYRAPEPEAGKIEGHGRFVTGKNGLLCAIKIAFNVHGVDFTYRQIKAFLWENLSKRRKSWSLPLLWPRREFCTIAILIIQQCKKYTFQKKHKIINNVIMKPPP